MKASKTLQDFKIKLAALFLFFSLVLTSCVSLTYSSVENYYLERNYKPIYGPIPDDYHNNPNLPADFIFLRMLENKDPFMQKTGAALAKLPDMNDGFTVDEVEALRIVFNTALTADEDERAVLNAFYDENPAPNQFSASLQGFFWMVAAGDFTHEKIASATKSDMLDYAWRHLGEKLHSPDDILQFMRKNFTYVLNRYTAVSRREFFSRKYGDCTEFSMFAGYWLQQLGYDVYILLSKPTSISGHASVVYSDGTSLWLLDGSRYTIRTILKEKSRHNSLSFLDSQVWEEMKDFDRIFGPSRHSADLVKIYSIDKKKAVPFRLISYNEYSNYVEANGREAPEWWEF